MSMIFEMIGLEMIGLEIIGLEIIGTSEKDGGSQGKGAVHGVHRVASALSAIYSLGTSL